MSLDNVNFDTFDFNKIRANLSSIEPYIEELYKINQNRPQFNSDIEEELYYTTLELNRYQKMTQEVLDYAVQHLDVKEINDIFTIIKNNEC